MTAVDLFPEEKGFKLDAEEWRSSEKVEIKEFWSGTKVKRGYALVDGANGFV